MMAKPTNLQESLLLSSGSETSLQSARHVILHRECNVLSTTVPQQRHVLQDSPYFDMRHYTNVKNFVGEAISTLLSRSDGPFILASDVDNQDWLKTSQKMRSFIAVHDPSGTFFPAFWEYNVKRDGDILPGRLGGRTLFAKRMVERTGKMSQLMVSIFLPFP